VTAILQAAAQAISDNPMGIAVHLVTGERQTRSFDGHALDFGEGVVRQAAYRRAAEQVAEEIEAALRNQ
jgi:hypothetical protein